MDQNLNPNLNSKDEISVNHHQPVFIQSKNDSVVEKTEQEQKEREKNLIEQTNINGLSRVRHFVMEELKINEDFLEISFIKNDK